MECYKDVEKSSKMKSYSNQSIMLAALELEDIDLSPEAEEAVKFLESSIEELEDQCEKLEGEYEKISQKKIRKNNLTMIEERKQELEGFSNRNKFHIEKMEMVIDFLKKDKISPDAVFAIQEDITFYLESNQEPDFIDDDTLYDELTKEASRASTNNNIDEENSQNGTWNWRIWRTLSIRYYLPLAYVLLVNPFTWHLQLKILIHLFSENVIKICVL